MKQIFEMKLFRRLASASVDCSLRSLFRLVLRATGHPGSKPGGRKLDGKESKEAKKVVEQPKPPEPRFKLYGWIEAGITGNPDSPVDNHNFGHL